MAYNGWANYETWNVALWLQNDEGLYSFAREARGDYDSLAAELRDIGARETPDGVAYNYSGLDTDELDNMLRELRGEEE